MINNKLHTTEGVKDYLPEECALKNQIEAKIRAVFEGCNYKCVITPTFEYIQVYEGMGGVDTKRMYKFLDRDGSILALRPEVTPAIARIAATAYDKEDLPLRLCYVGNAFRYNENYQGKLREFTQAGVELIGVNSIDADAEAVIIAINSLLAVGIEDFKVDIAHVDFLKGVLEEAELDAELREAVTDSVTDKNYVEVAALTDSAPIKAQLKRLFKDLPLLIGGAQVLKNARGLVENAKSLRALDYMEELYNLLEDCGYSRYISFDLSVTGHFDYYTGIVFRAYTRGTGFSVIDGGRYDGLVGSCGNGISCPAVGLAVKINDLMSVLRAPRLKGADLLIAYSRKGRAEAIRQADILRKNGAVAELSLLGEDIELNRQYALNRKIDRLLYFDGEGCREIELKEAE